MEQRDGSMTRIEQTIKVDPKQSAIRLDLFLMDRLLNVTRSRLQGGIKDGHVLVNDQMVKPNYKVRPGDHIVINIPRPLGYGTLQAEPIPIDIRYEDDHLLVLYKPAGLVVHPGVGNYSGTLVNGLLHHYQQIEWPQQESPYRDRPGLVHRIDKNTSGLLVIAKTDDALVHLSKQFHDHTIRREYYAIIWGAPDKSEGTIRVHIGRHPTRRLMHYAYEDGDHGKPAVTHYQVVEDLYYISLVKCQLETGRTHQIRVHFKYLNHPIFSDSRYGGDSILKGTVYTKYKQFVQNCFDILPRQALHAKSLGFIHPKTNKEMFFDTDLPDDMANVLEKWRHYLTHRKRQG